MCGRIRLATEWSQIKIRLRLDDRAPALNLRPSWNIPPSRDVVAVRSEAGGRRAELARWGLIPHWAKTGKVGATFNARSDGLTRKPSFRDAWRASRRCPVVADGFYEWREWDR
jgi:putative SOS response-associated peptidase YedK